MNDDLETRLHRLGEQPVDTTTQAMHLQAMASVRIRNRSLRDKLQVGAALAGGFLLGSTGLAFAGALPTPAQDVASTTLAKVGVSVPVGTERYFGEECVAAEDGSHARNRGQYLKQERAKGDDALIAAKASDCGKPLSSLNDSDDAAESDDTDDVADVADESSDDSNKPEKCVDGVKVTGKSNGKGKSDDAAKSTKPCETPSAANPPAASSDDDADAADEVTFDDDEADDEADAAEADDHSNKPESTPADDANPSGDRSGRGSDD